MFASPTDRRNMNPAEYWLFSLFFITAGWWLHKWLGE
jgi:hypothetical protein